MKSLSPIAVAAFCATVCVAAYLSLQPVLYATALIVWFVCVTFLICIGAVVSLGYLGVASDGRFLKYVLASRANKDPFTRGIKYMIRILHIAAAYQLFSVGFVVTAALYGCVILVTLTMAAMFAFYPIAEDLSENDENGQED
jgi:hypothetical protein